MTMERTLLSLLSAGVVVLLGGLLGALIGGILGRKTVPEEGRKLQSDRGIACGRFQGALLSLRIPYFLVATYVTAEESRRPRCLR
jgi:hypothetical protein